MLIPIAIVNVLYPSLWNVCVCVGASIFIYIGSNSSFTPIANKVLSTKPLVAIGLISYSLYLWHWPIIAYINYLSIAKSTFVCIIIVLSSIALAFLSYKFIEKPFRHSKLSIKQSLIVLLIIPTLFSLVFVFASRYENFGFNQQPKNLDLNYFGGQILANSGCHTEQDYNANQINNKCYIGDLKNKKTNILILGDSHAMATQGMISTWLIDSKQKGYIYTKSLTIKSEFYKYIMYNQNFVKNVQFYIYNLHPKTIILGGDWSSSTYENTNAYQHIKNALKIILKNKSILF